MKDITQAVSEFVRERGFRINAIAEQTGISRNVLYHSFSGKRKLRADEYLAICDFLGKDPEDFRNHKSA